MKYFTVLLVICLFACPIPTVLGEYSCVAYNSSEVVSPCSEVNPSFYAYIDEATSSLAADMAQMNGWITALGTSGSHRDCNIWIQVWSCQVASNLKSGLIPALPSCAVDALGLPIEPPTPVPICRDLCDEYYTACKPALDAAGLGEYMGPGFCDNYTNDGLTYRGQHIACYNATPGNWTGPATCPQGMSLVDSGCYPSCPSPEYSSDQVFDLGLMQQIVAWISFVATACLVVSFIVLPRLRKFPNRIVLCLLIATMPLSLAFMLATFVGGNVGDVWCGDTGSFNTDKLGGDTSVNADVRAIATGGLCIFQAWLIVWGTLATGIWWVLLIVNSTYIILLSRRFSQDFKSVRLEALYHLLGWGLPTILVIIPTAADKMDYESTNVFCFISSADDQGWRIGCWFVPMGIIAAIGFVSLAVSSYYLVVSKGKRALRSLVIIRLCCAFLIILITITLFLAFLIFSSSELQNNLIWIYSYLFCILAQAPESACRDQMNSGTTLVTNYNLGMAATFFACALGFLLAIFTASSTAFLRSVRSVTTTDSHSGSNDATRSATSPTSTATNRDAFN